MPSKERLEKAQERVESNLKRIRDKNPAWSPEQKKYLAGIRSTQILALLEYVVELEERLEKHD